MIGVTRSFEFVVIDAFPSTTHRSLKYERNKRLAHILVLHEGVPHRVVPLERLPRAAHEFHVEMWAHVLGVVVSKHLGEVAVREDIVVYRFEANVIILNEIGPVAAVECLNDVREGFELLLGEWIGTEPVDRAERCVVVAAQARIGRVAFSLETVRFKLQHIVGDVLALGRLPTW